MIYLERAFIIVLLLVSLIAYPWEMCIRYIITGKDQHEKTLAFKLINKITKDG